MNHELIPHEKLQEGFDKCKQQIQNLIDAAEALYSGKKYSTAVPLAILAFEETGKLRLLHDHIRSSSSMTEQDWNLLTRDRKAHPNKLTKTYTVGKKMIQSSKSEIYYENMIEAQAFGFGTDTRPYEIAKEINKEIIGRLEKLDKIKQECFYVNWNNCSWTSFNGLNKTSKDALAFILILTAKIGFLSIVIMNKYPSSIPYNSSEFQKFLSDPQVVALKGLHTEVLSEKTKKKAAIANIVIDAYFKQDGHCDAAKTTAMRQ